MQIAKSLYIILCFPCSQLHYAPFKRIIIKTWQKHDPQREIFKKNNH